jgi:hypothetical protein
MIKLDSAANVSIKVALYGEAKSGKTTSALQFPDPIVLQDGVSLGARFLTRRLISIISIEQLIQACSQLASARGEYKTVVFDDFGLMLRRWTTAASVGQKEPRLAFKAVYSRIEPAVSSVMSTGRNVVFTLHNTTTSEPVEGGKDRKVLAPWLPDVLQKWLTASVDLTAYCFKAGKGYQMLCHEDANKDRRITAATRAGLIVPRIVDSVSLAGTIADALAKIDLPAVPVAPQKTAAELKAEADAEAKQTEDESAAIVEGE